ncbi:MAG: hypothetical protein NXH97_18275 [Rhodobacteraceae bacterium]|nr:hypothetical protein [Paracoccaceae bacterium]
MIDKSSLYDCKLRQDAEGSCYAILNLCRVGIAATDSAMAVDLSKGGFEALFEAIGALAEDAIDRMETENTRQSKAKRTEAMADDA